MTITAPPTTSDAYSATCTGHGFWTVDGEYADGNDIEFFLAAGLHEVCWFDCDTKEFTCSSLDVDGYCESISFEEFPMSSTGTDVGMFSVAVSSMDPITTIRLCEDVRFCSGEVTDEFDLHLTPTGLGGYTGVSCPFTLADPCCRFGSEKIIAEIVR